METRKRRRDAAELAAKNCSLLDTLHSNLPEVFAAEILPKLDMTDTLSLAQVNKAYNDTVWSADGVRSMRAKIKAHLVNIGKKDWIVEPLYWAIKFGNVPAVRACLKSGEDVNKLLTLDEKTALHVAALFGHAAVVKALIEAGADVNKPASRPTLDASGNRIVPHKNWTPLPLYWAVAAGNVPAVRVLLESGMDVNKDLTGDKRTALHVAALYGHAALVKALIEAGADVNKTSSAYTVSHLNHKVTPVCAAAHRGHTHVVMELIKAGADVNLATSKGFTPLYAAAQNGREGIVALLIQAGADVRKARKNGWTPMKIATRNKWEKVVTLLKFYERV